MRRRGLSYPTIMVMIALTLSLTIGGLWVATKHVRAAKRQARSAAESEAKAASLFMLPRRSFTADSVLGRSRAEVHAALGAPQEELGAVDAFDVSGVEVRVRYEGDRSAGLLVTVPHAAQNERAVRRWLALPLVDPVELGGRAYRVGPPLGEQDTIEILDAGLVRAPPKRAAAPAAAPVAKASAAGASPDLRLAGELLRAFPAIPAGVADRCRRAAMPGGAELSCERGLDAKVLYELDGAGAALTLTVLDPPVGADEAGCREFLVKNARTRGAPVRAADASQRSEYFAGGPVDAFYTWARDAASGPPCSVMACRAGVHRRSGACAPPR